MKGLSMRAAGGPGFHLKHGRGLQGSAQMLGHLRLSFNAIAILAILSDTCAVVGASIMTGGAYHTVVFGHVESFNQFFGVGAIVAAATVALMKQNGHYALDSLLSIHSQVKPLILIWTGVLL